MHYGEKDKTAEQIKVRCLGHWRKQRLCSLQAHYVPEPVLVLEREARTEPTEVLLEPSQGSLVCLN